MTKTSKLQAEIQEKETQLLELKDKRRQSKEQIDALETERRGFVVAARVHKSPDAQKAIERIAGKIAKAQDEDTLNGEAFTQVSGELEAPRAELRREEWREGFEPLRRLLKSRMTGELEQQALKLALDLRAKLEEIAGKDKDVIERLHGIHESLSKHAYILRSSGERRSGIISSNLEPFLANPFSKAWRDIIGKDPVTEAATTFGNALQAVDRVAEMEPEGEPA